MCMYVCHTVQLWYDKLNVFQQHYNGCYGTRLRWFLSISDQQIPHYNLWSRPNKCYDTMECTLLSQFYQQFHAEWDAFSAIVVDVCVGPCIYPHISAALYVAEIYHASNVQSCCDKVLMWKNSNPNAYDWSAHVVNTLEGQKQWKSARRGWVKFWKMFPHVMSKLKSLYQPFQLMPISSLIIFGMHH